MHRRSMVRRSVKTITKRVMCDGSLPQDGAMSLLRSKGMVGVEYGDVDSRIIFSN